MTLSSMHLAEESGINWRGAKLEQEGTVGNVIPVRDNEVPWMDSDGWKGMDLRLTWELVLRKLWLIGWIVGRRGTEESE